MDKILSGQQMAAIEASDTDDESLYDVLDNLPDYDDEPDSLGG